MSDHERIYLQPECCANSMDGRLWCQDPDPEDCEEGVPWTEYVRADVVAALQEREERYREALATIAGVTVGLFGDGSMRPDAVSYQTPAEFVAFAQGCARHALEER